MKIIPTLNTIKEKIEYILNWIASFLIAGVYIGGCTLLGAVVHPLLGALFFSVLVIVSIGSLVENYHS